MCEFSDYRDMPEGMFKTAARNKLVEKWMHMVHNQAGKYATRSNPGTLDDAISHGSLGLMSAVKNFVPRGSSWTRYAKQRIWGAIQDGFRSEQFFGRKGSISQLKKNQSRRPISLHSMVKAAANGSGSVNSSLATDLLHTITAPGVAVGSEAEEAEQWDRLLAPLMDAQHKRIVLLLARDGLLHREISQRVGLSLGRVSQIIKEVRQVLRESAVA